MVLSVEPGVTDTSRFDLVVKEVFAGLGVVEVLSIDLVDDNVGFDVFDFVVIVDRAGLGVFDCIFEGNFVDLEVVDLVDGVSVVLDIIIGVVFLWIPNLVGVVDETTRTFFITVGGEFLKWEDVITLCLELDLVVILGFFVVVGTLVVVEDLESTFGF